MHEPDACTDPDISTDRVDIASVDCCRHSHREFRAPSSSAARVCLEPHGVVSVAIPLHESTYASWQSRVEYFESLCNSIRTLSDVVSASVAANATPPHSGWRLLFEMLGKPVASPDTQMANVNLVDSDYFRTLETPLLQGRIWNSTEVANGSQLVLVNRSFVRRYSSNENVVGRSLRIHNLQSRPPSTTSSSRSKQTTAVRQIPD